MITPWTKSEYFSWFTLSFSLSLNFSLLLCLYLYCVFSIPPAVSHFLSQPLSTSVFSLTPSLYPLSVSFSLSLPIFLSPLSRRLPSLSLSFSLHLFTALSVPHSLWLSRFSFTNSSFTSPPSLSPPLLLSLSLTSFSITYIVNTISLR